MQLSAAFIPIHQNWPLCSYFWSYFNNLGSFGISRNTRFQWGLWEHCGPSGCMSFCLLNIPHNWQIVEILGIFTMQKLNWPFKPHGSHSTHQNHEVLPIPKQPSLWLCDQKWGHSDAKKTVDVKSAKNRVKLLLFHKIQIQNYPCSNFRLVACLNGQIQPGSLNTICFQ